MRVGCRVVGGSGRGRDGRRKEWNESLNETDECGVGREAPRETGEVMA